MHSEFLRIHKVVVGPSILFIICQRCDVSCQPTLPEGGKDCKLVKKLEYKVLS